MGSRQAAARVMPPPHRSGPRQNSTVQGPHAVRRVVARSLPGAATSRLGENFLVVDLPQHLRCVECKRHAPANVYESSR